tara:strand:- start:5147 stop:5632 length:486 start_codon:yes stop_codon:yes gene_type:complete
MYQNFVDDHISVLSIPDVASSGTYPTSGSALGVNRWHGRTIGTIMLTFKIEASTDCLVSYDLLLKNDTTDNDVGSWLCIGTNTDLGTPQSFSTSYWNIGATHMDSARQVIRAKGKVVVPKLDGDDQYVTFTFIGASSSGAELIGDCRAHVQEISVLQPMKC